MAPIPPPPTDWKTARWWQNRPFEERLAWSRIPSRFDGVRMKDLHFDAPYVDAIHQYATGYTKKSPGLLITGPSNAGKTVMAVATFRVLLKNFALSGRFVDSDRYVEMLKDQFDNDNELPEMYAMPHLVKYIKGVFDVVILDGLGQERLTEFAQHELGSLLRRRYDDCHTTIVTSSMSPSDLIKRYGQRIAGVINDMQPLAVK